MSFIHLPTEGHFDCFQVSGFMNRAAVNIHVQIFEKINFSTFLDKYQSEINGLYGKGCIYFCRKLQKCPPKWLYHFASPPMMNQSSFCSISSPAFRDTNVPEVGHYNRYVAISFFLMSFMTYDV